MASNSIVVVDDDPEFRRSLAGLLTQAGYRVQTYATVSEFFDDCDSLSDVGAVLLDERIDEESGLEAYRELRRRDLHWPVLLVTGHATVALAVEALDSGVCYLLEKPVSGALLLSRLERCVERHQDQQRQQAWRREQQQQLATLSERERQIVQMLADGWLNKQIAKRLDVSLRTVETYRKRVMEKTGADSLADLVVFAVSVGIRDAAAPQRRPRTTARHSS